MFVYILLVGVGYFIDTQTRKEPALITLFTIPAFSFILLLAFFIMSEVYWVYYLFLVLVFTLIYFSGFMCYKKWISKILQFKIGYENTLFIYLIIHLFIVLLISFNVMGLI
jgi:hypothetical protein